MKIHHCIQKSPEWWELRRGIPTASDFDKIMQPVKCKPSASQVPYICQLIADRICLTPPFFTEREGHTAAMRNGENLEPAARSWYELESGFEIEQVGFCTTDDGRLGCSPDGLVKWGDQYKGGLELKCPELKTHMAYLLDGSGLPSEYGPQVHGQLIVTGLPFVDFMSYAPGAPPLLVRVEPDDYTEKLRAALEEFWGRYQTAWEKVQQMGGRT